MRTDTTAVQAAAWAFRIGADSDCGVWLSLAVGHMSGGQFITTADARALAAALTAHADAADAAAKVAA